MKAAEANKTSEVVRIATKAKGWNLVLTDYYGKDATEMKLKDINGNSLSISGLKGKKAIIVRWSTGNKESKNMIKTLAELQTQVGAENLAVIAISSDDPAILKPVIKDLDIHFHVVGRGNRLKDPYRKNLETPVCFFIDKAGKIQLIAQKPISADVLKSVVEAL